MEDIDVNIEDHQFVEYVDEEQSESQNFFSIIVPFIDELDKVNIPKTKHFID